MDENLKKGLDTIQANIDKLQEKQEAELKNAGKVASETTAELEKAMDSYKEEMKNIYGIQQEQLDNIEKAQKDLRESGFSHAGQENIADVFKAFLDNNEEIQNVKARKIKQTGLLEIDRKAVQTMSTTATFTGQVSGYTRNETIIPQILRTIHIRDLFAQGTMTGGHYELIRNTGGEGGPTYVDEGATKPNSDEDLALVQIPAAKIAVNATLTEEALEDTAGLASFMATKMIGDIRRLEDTKLLYGTGSGDITGISQFTGVVDLDVNPYTPEVIASATNVQAVIAALTVMWNANVMPSVILMAPSNYGKILSDLSTGGADVALGYSFQGGQVNIAGIPVIMSTAVAAGDLFIFDPSYATVFQRKGLSVQTSNEHASNFINNLVTMQVEERLAFVPWREEAFGFSDDISGIVTALAST